MGTEYDALANAYVLKRGEAWGCSAVLSARATQQVHCLTFSTISLLALPIL